MKAPRLTAAACAALLEERAAMPAPRRASYPWAEWSRPDVVHVAESGVDYWTGPEQFAAVLSTYARRHGLSVQRSTFQYEPENGGPARAVVLFRFSDNNEGE